MKKMQVKKFLFLVDEKVSSGAGVVVTGTLARSSQYTCTDTEEGYLFSCRFFHTHKDTDETRNQTYTWGTPRC